MYDLSINTVRKFHSRNVNFRRIRSDEIPFSRLSRIIRRLRIWCRCRLLTLHGRNHGDGDFSRHGRFQHGRTSAFAYVYADV